MKKLLTLAFALLFVLCLGACGQLAEKTPVEFTFPEGSTVLGVNLSGMSKEAGWAAMEETVNGYTATINVDGVEAVVTAQDMDLTCSKEIFMACADAVEQNVIPDYTGLISFNEGKLRVFVSEHFNKDVTEAAITYDEAAGEYILVPHADGQSSNPNAIVDGVKDAICQLSAPQALTGLSEILHPIRSADDPEITQALEAVNKMLTTQLTYTFSPDGNDTDHVISSEDIRSFVAIGEDGITPVINEQTLDTYVAALEEKYSLSGSKGDFKTTSGSTVNLTVSYNGHLVDGDGLKEDLIKSIMEGASGTRTAPYKASGNRDMAYGGTYIEVDLTEQHLWFYKDGERLASTDLVSGCVATDCRTPTGIYAIYAKSTDTYLVGENYRSFVNYWMPFHYGYGLHDATWRGSFGGEIYVYSGSHGCLNLPLKAASKIYSNASVGTKVIIYGGKTSVPPVSNKLNGTKSYDVAEDAGSFNLNIKPKYSGGKITYSSDNTSVATVTDSGKVTITGTGKATITVHIEKYSYYKEASTQVTINVHSVCDEGRHPWGSATTVKAPTCVPGLEKITCTKCGKTQERELAAVQDHSYGQWQTVTAETCGEDGQKKHTCSVCGKTETGTIPATGNHTEGDWIVTKAATCTEPGSRKKECSVCGELLATEVIPATGAHEAGEKKIVVPATCTSEGQWEISCKHCGHEMETGEIKKTDHTYEWKTTKAATCTENGTQVQTCKCGATGESRTIAAKGHSFGSGETCDNCSEPNPNYSAPSSAPE